MPHGAFDVHQCDRRSRGTDAAALDHRLRRADTRLTILVRAQAQAPPTASTAHFSAILRWPRRPCGGSGGDIVQAATSWQRASIPPHAM